MEGQTPEVVDNSDQSFIDQPAVLDKHKGAAVIVDGKNSLLITLSEEASYLTLGIGLIRNN